MTWHAASETLLEYARGGLDDPVAYSVELHLVSCGSCRTELATMSNGPRLERIWSGIASEITLPRARPMERLLRAVGVPDHVARLLAATRSLQGSWFLAIAVALAFAVIAARSGGESIVVFLIVAPMLPLAGVAAAYGPGIDPTYEIGLASPLRSFRLLLLRAVAVLATTSVLALLAALALPQIGWATVAWVLPSLGLVTSTLALSTRVGPARAAALVALIWLATTLLGTVGAGSSVFGPPMQFGVLCLSLACAFVVGARRDAFEGDDRRWTR